MSAGYDPTLVKKIVEMAFDKRSKNNQIKLDKIIEQTAKEINIYHDSTEQ